MIVLQYTAKACGKDVYVHDDDTVTDVATGNLYPNAIITYNEDGTISVDLEGRGIQEIQPSPIQATIRITRQPGWQGNLGWKAELIDWKLPDPGVYALGVYQNPYAEGYLYTTGAFTLDPETGLYGTVCPPGFEPGDADIHFGMLYAATKYSPFTLFKGQETMDFQIGGPGA